VPRENRPAAAGHQQDCATSVPGLDGQASAARSSIPLERRIAMGAATHSRTQRPTRTSTASVTATGKVSQRTGWAATAKPETAAAFSQLATRSDLDAHGTTESQATAEVATTSKALLQATVDELDAFEGRLSAFR
jgi:hypothetical protein